MQNSLCFNFLCDVVNTVVPRAHDPEERDGKTCFLQVRWEKPSLTPYLHHFLLAYIHESLLFASNIWGHDT